MIESNDNDRPYSSTASNDIRKNWEDYFRPEQQFWREISREMHAYRLDIFTGPIFIFLSFYSDRSLGRFPVYDVILPFIVVGILAGIAALNSFSGEMKQGTCRFYRNLPRDRSVTWNVKMVFLACVILYQSCWVAMGIGLDLGGLGLVDQYRLYPLWMVFPLYGVACVIWGNVKGIALENVRQVALVLALAVWPFAAIWIEKNHARAIRMMEEPVLPRSIPLSIELIAAAVVLMFTAGWLLKLRREWLQPGWGELP